jgi:hypothetical protein
MQTKPVFPTKIGPKLGTGSYGGKLYPQVVQFSGGRALIFVLARRHKRAEAKITLANLAYNMLRPIFHE